MTFFDRTYAALVDLHPLFVGAGLVLCVIAAVQFLRIYRKTGDRLFLFFSAAFGLMCLNRVVFQLMGEGDEGRPRLYVLRLLAFCLILFAIADKNRGRRMR